MATKNQLKAPVDVRVVMLKAMSVSPVVQRELKHARVDHLLENFNLADFGMPGVSLRNGHYYIIDGQHRVAAYKAWSRTWEKEGVMCIVHEGLTESQEADMFLRLNDVLLVGSFDKYHKSLTAKRTVETTVQKILEE